MKRTSLIAIFLFLSAIRTTEAADFVHAFPIADADFKTVQFALIGRCKGEYPDSATNLQNSFSTWNRHNGEALAYFRRESDALRSTIKLDENAPKEIAYNLKHPSDALTDSFLKRVQKLTGDELQQACRGQQKGDKYLNWLWFDFDAYFRTVKVGDAIKVWGATTKKCYSEANDAPLSTVVRAKLMITSSSTEAERREIMASTSKVPDDLKQPLKEYWTMIQNCIESATDDAKPDVPNNWFDPIKEMQTEQNALMARLIDQQITVGEAAAKNEEIQKAFMGVAMKLVWSEMTKSLSTIPCASGKCD